MAQSKGQPENDTLARIDKLVDAVNYQEGSVASKTLIDKETGTIILFAFAKGQGLPAHIAPFDIMISILEGKAELVVAGKPYVLDAGEMITIPAKTAHTVKAAKPFKMMMVMVK
jgi:quercetin dioxygenase-like cupin family protein